MLSDNIIGTELTLQKRLDGTSVNNKSFSHQPPAVQLRDMQLQNPERCWLTSFLAESPPWRP